MPIIDIPDVGQVEFPDGMTDDDISLAAGELFTEASQSRLSPNPTVNQPIAPDYRLDPNAGLREEKATAARTGAVAGAAADVLSWADFLIRPFASTPENPLGPFGTAARGAGKVLNEAGNVGAGVARDVRLGNTQFPATGRALAGEDGGPSPGGPVGAGLDAAGRTLPLVAGGMALQAAGVPAPVAFGGPMAASTFEATGGDISAAMKSGAIGAVIPGLAGSTRELAASALRRGIEAGLRTGGNVPEKMVEALAAQGGIQVFMEGMNLPEYAAMTPEQRRDALIENLVANSAFLALDVPGVASKRASATREGMAPAAKVGELMEHLVNDPAAVEALRVAADRVALEAQNPQRAGLQWQPAEIANVEPRFVDPSLRPAEGREVPLDYVEPEPTETVVRAEEFQQRPAQTIEAPSAPAAAVPKAAPETVQPEARAEVDSSSTATAAAKGRSRSAKSSSPAAKSSAPDVPLSERIAKLEAERARVIQSPSKTALAVQKNRLRVNQIDAELTNLRGERQREEVARREAEMAKVAQANLDKGPLTADEAWHMERIAERNPRPTTDDAFILEEYRARSAAHGVAKPQTPPAAVAKVQEHVAEVAAGAKTATPEPALQHTTGPRAAKEIKSELVQRIEAELAKIPEFAEPHFSKPATYSGKKKFTAGIEGHAVEVREAFGDVWEIVQTVSKPDRKSPTGEKRSEVVLAKTGKYADLTAAKRLATTELEKLAFPARAKRQVTIEIPGDGTFIINGTRTALEQVHARAKALETSSAEKKAFSESLPTRAQGEMWKNEASDNPSDSFYVHTGRDNYRKVEGRALRLEEYPPGEFFLHKPVGQGVTGWSVSEVTSGMRIGHGATEKAAIANAREQLVKQGPEKIEAALQQARESGLVSPRIKGAPTPESIDTGALGKVGMGGAKPGEFQGGSGTPTSIKNAQVDIERAKRGLPPAIEPLRRSFGTVWEEAMARIDNDPAIQDRLIAELKDKPRAVTDLEDALLLHRQVELQNAYGRATREMAQAYDDAQAFPNRLEAVEQWKAMAAQASDQLLELYNINKSVGTETARGLNARKMMANEDYTLAQMELDKRLANEGAPLDPAQRAELEAAHRKITELQGAFNAYMERAEAERAQRRTEDTVREMAEAARKEPAYDPRILKIAEEIVEKLEKRAETARASVREKLARLNAGVDPTLVYELGVIGAAKIARKGLDLARFTTDMVAEFGEKVRPFINDVWTAANTYLEMEGAKYGDKAEPVKRLLRKRDELGRRENVIAGLKKAHAEGQPVDLLGDYVRKLAESFVRGGITTREALIDAVHGVLTAEVDAAITRRETMDAISGYGRFKPLNPDAIATQLRTLKGEMQQVAKLEDIQARQPLKKTGVERRVVGDEERRLLAQVNEAKRRYGVVVTDPARQLKSALDAITTRLKNSIADIEYQIATKARTVKTKTPAPTSPEVELLKARRETLRLQLDELLPRPELTDAQRLQMAERSVQRSIGQLEERIRNRDVAPDQTKRTPPNSPHLTALKAQREALRSEYELLRDTLDPARAERVALQTVKARMLAQEARYLDRLARGEFTPRARKEIALDPEGLRIKARLQLAKDAWHRGLEVDRLRRRTLLHKTGHAIRETLNVPRAVLSSWDFSAVLRQGGFIGLGNPSRAVRALPDMFRSWGSAERAEMVNQEILSRPNAPRYAQSKLYLAPLENTRLSAMEEAFMSRVARAIPGVQQSNRAFVTFLNRLRADSFDSLVGRIEANGVPLNGPELQAVANYINVATGRGDMGRAAAAAETLATVFFSPRLVTSRFQLALGQPAWAGSARTRRAVALEYAKFLGGLAVVYGLARMAGAELEDDPRSSDFGKLKFGNTRVDPLGGLSQTTVLMSRLASGQTKTGQGEVKDIRGKVPFGESTSADIIWRFMRSKLAPVPAGALDVASGSNVVGDEVTAGDVATRLLVPLSFSDIYEVMKEQGIPATTALGMLSVFGMGLQQQPDPDVRLVVGELMRNVKGTDEDRESIRKGYTEQFTTNRAGVKEWAEALRERKRAKEAK